MTMHMVAMQFVEIKNTRGTTNDFCVYNFCFARSLLECSAISSIDMFKKLHIIECEFYLF